VESLTLWELVSDIASCFSGTGALTAFQKAEAPAVLLLRTGFCTGLNQLADADVALFWSNPFSYSRRAQAEGRTRRISSTNKVTYVVDLVTKGGADEQVYHMLQQKQSFSLTLSALRSIR
jgi:hypothetical protein